MPTKSQVDRASGASIPSRDVDNRTSALRIGLFGAPGDTGNLGILALLHSVLHGVATDSLENQVTVFDNGWGVRSDSIHVGDQVFKFRRIGVRRSRRFHRRESYWNIQVSHWIGSQTNPALKAMLASHAIWDLSGGDSFSDLYGSKRFKTVVWPKQLALELERPLFLLPQTYGPFRKEAHRAQAHGILCRTSMAWARDGRSFEALRNLLGDGFEADKHREGVDMAFLLPPRTASISGNISAMIAEDRPRPTIGLNVSGLLFNDPDSMRAYDLSIDYGALILALLRSILNDTEANILLIPHVLAPIGVIESDSWAQAELVKKLGTLADGRVHVLDEGLDASEVKWVISRLDWFCGTRMHSTIAALSSRVPTAGIAYSRKMAGVFDACGQAETVADPRHSSLGECLEVIRRSWNERDAHRASLEIRIPIVESQAKRQVEVLLERTLRFAESECDETS